jgi:DNA polymerase bacteriophage-type
MILHLDFETCAEVDLRKVGADVYSRHPSLVVTVVAWAWDTDPVQSASVQWLTPRMLPGPGLFDHLKNGGAFKAWNASFEWAILVNHYGLRLSLDPGQAICTMQAALHSGLPPSLDDAGPAVGSSYRKNTSARRLMMQMSRPRRIEADGTRRYWHVDDPLKLRDLQAYCEDDVLAERDIDSMIAPLPPSELAVSRLDRAANERGVRLDLPFVGALKDLAKAETALLNAECAALTNGAVTSPGTQSARLLDWLCARLPTPLNDVSKESITGALAGFERGAFTGPVTQRVLEIRQEVAKSSLKKLDAMERCVGPGDRVRGQLAYYGAFRTGRFAGRLVQPQNFPRPPHPSLKFDQASFVRYMLRNDVDADFVRAAWVGNPLTNIAWSLRGCLIPAPGHVFVVRDLSQIEARVIAWLAGQQDILEVFVKGADVYVFTQNRLGLSSRQAGKTVVLGLGFGMGPAHFVDYAAKDGLTISLAESENIVREWREANPQIVQFWKRLGDTAMDLLRGFRGATVERRANSKISFCVSLARNGTCLLTMLLPSGRRLYYRNARIVHDPDRKRDSIVYDGISPYTKKWGDVRTWGSKLAENATQATARDVIVEAALRVDGFKLGDLVLSVHDELVFEVDEQRAGTLAKGIQWEIDRRPSWARDLPVASEGAIMKRYGK